MAAGKLGDATVVRFGGHMYVHTYGLRELSKVISGCEKQLARDISAGFKRAAEPVAERARQLAATFADTGQFASSIKITGGRAGVFLSSNDPAAGPIDFAHMGAVALSGPNVGARVGVPHGGGDPSRAFYPAIEDTIDDLAEALTRQIETTLMVLDMDFRSRD